MASVVDTSVKYFDSNMANAPALSGTVGSLIAVMDACLKDGFNTITLTSLVVASNVATATWSGTHAALKDAVILLAGASGGPTGYANVNGEQKVTAKTSGTTLTFATSGVADGTITGTITMKMAPLGWLKPQSGTNLAAYQSNDPASTKMLLRVDDTNAQWARVVGYESMTDINTGANAFPSAVQVPGGGYWAKSQFATSSPVGWSLHGDGRTFYINILSAATSVNLPAQMCAGRMFGDIIPYKPGGDAYACTLNYTTSSNVQTMYGTSVGNGSSGTGFALPRDYTGLGSAVLSSIFPIGVNGSANSGITGLFGAFPSPIDGGLWVVPKMLAIASSAPPRGILPGVLHAMQSGLWNTFKQGDTTPGTGTLAGRTLRAATTCDEATGLNTTSSATNTGIIFFDVTGPWR